jgi:hypothetical protein
MDCLSIHRDHIGIRLLVTPNPKSTMTPEHMHGRAANRERFPRDDEVMLSRLRLLICGIGIAAAFCRD